MTAELRAVASWVWRVLLQLMKHRLQFFPEGRQPVFQQGAEGKREILVTSELLGKIGKVEVLQQGDELDGIAAMLAAGADALKMFPAEQLGPTVLKAWRAVIPAGVALLPVGGITPANMAEYLQAGASGFGLGSALFKPGQGVEQVRQQARAFQQRWAELTAISLLP